MKVRPEYIEKLPAQAVGKNEVPAWVEPANKVTHGLQDAQLSGSERELVERLIDRLSQL